MTYLLLKKAYRAILITSTVLLMACSTSPTSVQLQPELSFKKTEPLMGSLIWGVHSQDQRIAHYLIAIENGDNENAARLVNESRNSRVIIEKVLQEQWIKQGLAIQADSANIIDIQLIKLLAEVEQNSLTYKIDSNIIIKVKLHADNKIFNKTFNSRFGEEGVFTADVEKVTKQLNDQLSQLLTEILHDSELNAKLQKI
ncbi:YajG family lipoprotein [Psychromonas sp.]|uniref:YajG family lipoprotein n=1 Tax=Psychromonas sp. TaxID=1884585 RepID=UPI0039E4DD1E